MDFSGMNHALEKKVTCVPWELCKLTPSPRGTEDNDFVLLAAYSLGVLKHGFSFERKDASVFFFSLKAVTWLSMARFGPGTHHKDICVSFGAVCQAHRLPRLSAHLPYGGQSPTFCQPKATGRLSGNRDSLIAAAGPGLGVTSGLHALWLPGSRGQYPEVGKAWTGSFV